MHNRGAGKHKRQTGALAIEYAIVFPVFFVLLYAILMYGFIFLARMGLQHAAEDGARAALNFPGAIPAGSTELQLRQANATTIAEQQSSWINAPVVDVSICAVGDSCTGINEAGCTQASAYTTRCQVLVTVTYNYADDPMVPPLPGLGLFVPSTLQGSARVLLDGRALSPP